MGKIICGIDIETTGLDVEKDFIAEIAWVIKDTEDPKPLKVASFFVLPEDIANFSIPDEVTELTKITKKHLIAGQKFESIADELTKDLYYFGVDAIAAHNGNCFDKPFILRVIREFGEVLATSAKVLEDLLWIDTSTDLTLPKDCKHNNLLYLSAYHGFLNPFPHAALSDVQSMLMILGRYDIEQVFERARSPWVVLQAAVNFDSKDLAKARRYSWERLGSSPAFYPRKWVKRVRAIDVQREKEDAPFQVVEVV